MRRPRNLRKLPWKARYLWLTRALSALRVLALRVTHLHCNLVFEGPVYIGPGFRLIIPDSGTLVIGAGAEFRGGFYCEIAGDGKVVIGPGTIFSSNAMIQCSTSIEIGERCAIGQSVLIYDGYHRYSDPDRHWLDQGYDFDPITIGDGVGISDKCTVKADIGERAMIASQSVVSRPIPPYSVAAGIPARVVRSFGPSEKASTIAAGDGGT
jgi:acetyltransferase-like isoleucine patch superfamily enzyme